MCVVRVAGNVVYSSSIASLEYAVTNLNTKLIVVLEHQSCGAITAAVEGGDNGPNLNHLLAHVAPAISASNKDATINDVIKKNAELTTVHVRNKSAILKEAFDSDSINIIPACYNLDSKKVDFL